MKIAFISSEVWSLYNPEGIVARKILNGFIDLGYDIEVITTKDFDHYNVKVLENNIPEILDKFLKNIIGLEKIFFVIKAYFYIKRKVNDYDLIITRSEPVSLHLINCLIKTENTKKISMFSDVGYLSPYYSKFYFLKKLVSYLIEKKLLNSCNLITHTNQFVIDKYVAQGFKKEKYIVFPNPVELHQDYIKYNISRDTIHLAYIGSLYGNRKPNKLFEYLSYQDNKNFVLYLVGAVRNIYYEQGRFGKSINYLKNSELSKLQMDIKKFGIEDNVKILPFMNKQELVKFIGSEVDILVNIDAMSDTNLFLSSKVVDYVQYQIPILNISNQGASVDFLRKMGVAEYMDYNKPFNFTLKYIVDSGDFLPNQENISNFFTTNLLKKLFLELNED